ncbi:MAG: hypothetical protein Q9183_005159 [Haloplaca sp. 2 TL-2023]
MPTPTGHGEHLTLPIRPSSAQPHSPPSLPPPPTPSEDTGIIPQLTSPATEAEEHDLVSGNKDLDIFKMSPSAALKLLGTTVETLIKLTADVPPTPPLSTAHAPRSRVVSLGKENQQSHSRSSSIDKRRSQPPRPEGWVNAESVPERAKTPIGSPEAKSTEPLHAVGTVPEPVDLQLGAVVRKFYSKKPPPISVEMYLLRVHKYCPMSTGVLLAAGMYIYQLAITQRSIAVTPRNVHRFLLAALRVAAKANDDHVHSPKRFATVGGITTTELARLEIAFCFLTDFELRATANMLQNHANAARDSRSIGEKLRGFNLRLPDLTKKKHSAVDSQTVGSETKVSAAT